VRGLKVCDRSRTWPLRCPSPLGGLVAMVLELPFYSIRGFASKRKCLTAPGGICCSWLVKTTNNPMEDVPETEARRSGGWEKRSLAGLRFS
jgi:hypothetical protein